jgi:hypothetical protein
MLHHRNTNLVTITANQTHRLIRVMPSNFLWALALAAVPPPDPSRATIDAKQRLKVIKDSTTPSPGEVRKFMAFPPLAEVLV